MIRMTSFGRDGWMNRMIRFANGMNSFGIGMTNGMAGWMNSLRNLDEWMNETRDE